MNNNVNDNKRKPGSGRPDTREDQLEGRNPVREALRAGRGIDKLWVLRPAADAEADRDLTALAATVRAQGGVVMEVERRALDRLAQTRNHQGVIARLRMQDYVPLERLLEIAAERGEDPFLFILDEIQDPYNLGSLLRIADAAGMHGVVIPQRRSASLDGTVARTSAGASSHVAVARVTNLVQAMDRLREAGVWIAGTAVTGAERWDQARLTGPLAIVIGNEGRGLRPLVQSHCDLLLTIPMLGRINSLNAAVSAGILAYEVLRQRGLASKD
ncbi:MAG: 23S rRNA (guanosine(2251)-2'-O)-methyltransferase RlmB [Bacillota bacterium]|nr:23S rRNA (guanosine(2251)-2'-O)-methyltransferase RlmB [Bacillota bacterium]